MSATDELRRLLDERGVEWRNNDKMRWVSVPHQRSTIFCDENGNQVIVTQALSGNLALNGRIGLTPEQAVEATLGRGECRNLSKYVNVFECSCCGWAYDFVTDPYSGPRYCPNCGRRMADGQPG